MKIYTKTGDDGTTGLFNGQRISKSSLRVEAYGTVDELNSIIGLALSHDMPERMREPLEKLSHKLFNLGTDLATPLKPVPKFEVSRITTSDIDWLEKIIDEYTGRLPKLKNFILPGGTKAASFLHLARTVCRRAERRAVALAMEDELGEHSVKFLNRLSDFLFTAARMANFLAGKKDTIVGNI